MRTSKLNAYEAIMVLRETYANHFIKSNKRNTFENYAYGTIMKYDEEDINKYVNRYEATLDEYLRHDVKKYFGLTIEEYLNLTFNEKDLMLEACVRETKRLLEAAEKAKQDSNAEVDKIKTSMRTKSINYEGLKPQKRDLPKDKDLSGFDFEEILGE